MPHAATNLEGSPQTFDRALARNASWRLLAVVAAVAVALPSQHGCAAKVASTDAQHVQERGSPDAGSVPETGGALADSFAPPDAGPTLKCSAARPEPIEVTRSMFPDNSLGYSMGYPLIEEILEPERYPLTEACPAPPPAADAGSPPEPSFDPSLKPNGHLATHGFHDFA